MLEVLKGKGAAAQAVQVPRCVSVHGGPEATMAYVGAWSPGKDTLVGVPLQDAKVQDALVKAGLGAWDLDGLSPSGSKGFTMADVKAILPPEEAKPPAPGEEG